MITPMKKVTILCLASEQERTLLALRKAGVLHVAPRAAAGDRASEAEAANIETMRKAVAILAASAADEEDARGESAEARRIDSAGALAAHVVELDARLKALAERESAARREHAAVAPLGDFNPRQIAELESRGIETLLFRLPAKRDFPAGDGVARLGATEGYAYGVAFNSEPGGLEGLEILPLPQSSLSEIESRLRSIDAESRGIRGELSALRERAADLEAATEELGERYTFLKVGESMKLHGAIMDLEGYCPRERISSLQEKARRHGWALWVRDPSEEDNVPVKLDLPRWLRPVAVLFNGLGILPGYREADVSAVFLLFFSLFFAMLVGDAGYGFLMLAVVLWLRRRKPDAPAQPFWLFGVFAVSTIVWGVLTGSYFAIETENLPKLMHGIPWLKVEDNLMWLCFLIGGAHLTIAHLWNAVIYSPSRKALAELGWIGVVWLMFGIAANLVVGMEIPAFLPWMGGIGVVLIVLFMTNPRDFKNDWINHPMLVLDLISCLVDVISYVRLFAVGMASAQIAMNFNQMALGLPLPIWIKPLGVVLILALGHGLNLMLGALSILVHAVRLNTLEFSNHKGLSWSGQPYTPFRSKDLPFEV